MGGPGGHSASEGGPGLPTRSAAGPTQCPPLGRPGGAGGQGRPGGPAGPPRPSGCPSAGGSQPSPSQTGRGATCCPPSGEGGPGALCLPHSHPRKPPALPPSTGFAMPACLPPGVPVAGAALGHPLRRWGRSDHTKCAMCPLGPRGGVIDTRPPPQAADSEPQHSQQRADAPTEADRHRSSGSSGSSTAASRAPHSDTRRRSPRPTLVQAWGRPCVLRPSLNLGCFPCLQGADMGGCGQGSPVSPTPSYGQDLLTQHPGAVRGRGSGWPAGRGGGAKLTQSPRQPWGRHLSP